MSECTLTREKMPLLLTESLAGGEREDAYLHIEGCEGCSGEWTAMRDTWSLLAVDRDRPVPNRLRARFDAAIAEKSAPSVPDNVVSFWRRPAAKWLAQAAAVVTLVGGAYFTGSRAVDGAHPTQTPTAEVAQMPSQFTLAANRIVPASQLAPQIEGAPAISNVRFEESPEQKGQVAVSFDLTSNVTVTGSSDEKSFVSLMAYLLQDRSNPTPSQSDAIQWVRQTYGTARSADPAIVGALANVLQSEANEGVRLRVIDTLAMQAKAGGGEQARNALIEALKNDPNPAVRIKAVEALTNMLSGEGSIDSVTVETLRDKASQADENPYVRIKAAEALSQLSL